MNKILVIIALALVGCSSIEKDKIDYIAREDVKLMLIKPPNEICQEPFKSLGNGLFDIYEAGINRGQQLKECSLFNDKKQQWIKDVCNRKDIECNK